MIFLISNVADNWPPTSGGLYGILRQEPPPRPGITDWLTFLIVLRLIKNNFLEIIWPTGWLFDWLVDFWAKQMGYVLGGSATTAAEVHNDNVADQ